MIGHIVEYSSREGRTKKGIIAAQIQMLDDQLDLQDHPLIISGFMIRGIGVDAAKITVVPYYQIHKMFVADEDKQEDEEKVKKNLSPEDKKTIKQEGITDMANTFAARGKAMQQKQDEIIPPFEDDDDLPF